eukprot:15458864-Alexandrium_andersonii.AAC.1
MPPGTARIFSTCRTQQASGSRESFDAGGRTCRHGLSRAAGGVTLAIPVGRPIGQTTHYAGA